MRLLDPTPRIVVESTQLPDTFHRDLSPPEPRNDDRESSRTGAGFSYTPQYICGRETTIIIQNESLPKFRLPFEGHGVLDESVTAWRFP